jgi:VWFA-related protein
LALARAQAQVPVFDLTVNYIEATALDNGEVQVSAFVSVLNEDGQPTTSLTVDDFTVFENNTPIETQALTVAPATAPTTITLLIDTSSSMAQPGPNGVRAIDAAKDAVITFIEALREDDQVAVYDYNSQAHRVQDFTYDHNLAIDQGVVKLNAAEAQAACLYDALLSVVEALQQQQQGQRVVIVLTGNPDSATQGTCSGATVDDVLEVATTVGNSLPIFSTGFGPNLNQEELTRLSQRTGGRSLLASDPTQLTELLQALSAQLKSQYEISYATQAASGPTRITITENSSQDTDRRQVIIPLAIEPTPTSPPQFLIDLTIDQKLAEGKLKVKVNAPADVTLTKTELFINNELEQQKVEPPFDQFDLDIAELGSGQHNIRVEATAENGVIAAAEVELTLSLLPTPTPTITSTPIPTAVSTVTATTDSGLIGSVPILPLLLIIAGLLLLLALVGLIAYILFFYAKRPTMTSPPTPPPPPVKPPTPVEGPIIQSTPRVQPGPTDPRELLVRRAKLVAVAGQQALSQSVFGLQKLETKIGRNTPKEVVNDIPIQDKEVSRSHAKIIYRDHEFFIQDLNSASGTRVNGVKLNPFKEITLPNGAEIMIGPLVKFRFEFFVPRSINETLDDETGPEGLWAKDDSQDPDRTLYDI